MFNSSILVLTAWTSSVVANPDVSIVTSPVWPLTVLTIFSGKVGIFKSSILLLIAGISLFLESNSVLTIVYIG
jgi:hypothetical protein